MTIRRKLSGFLVVVALFPAGTATAQPPPTEAPPSEPPPVLRPPFGVMERYALPIPAARLAVTADRALWAAGGSGGLYRRSEDGSVRTVSAATVPSSTKGIGRIDGITADGDGVVVLARDHLVTLDARGGVRSSRPLPEEARGARGLARAGETWIVAVPPYRALLRLDRARLEVRGRIDTPAGRVHAIATDAETVFVADRRDDRVYCVPRTSDGSTSVVVPPIDGVRGLALNGPELLCSFAKEPAVVRVRRAPGPHLGPGTRHTIALWVRAANVGKRPAKVELVLPAPAPNERQSVEWSRWYGFPEPNRSRSSRRPRRGATTTRRRKIIVPPGESRAACWIAGVTVHKYAVNHAWGGAPPAPSGPTARALRGAVSRRLGVASDTVKKIYADEVAPARGAIGQLDAMSRAIGKRLVYRMDGRWSHADAVLDQGHGSCSEYTTVSLGLLWLGGYDARYAGSTLRHPQSNGWWEDWAGHRWPECRVDGLGWAPFDPTWNDGRHLRRRYLLNLSDRHFVLVRAREPGSALGWRYRGAVKRLGWSNLVVSRYSTWLPAATEAEIDGLTASIRGEGGLPAGASGDLESEVRRARLIDHPGEIGGFAGARVGDASLALFARVAAAIRSAKPGASGGKDRKPSDRALPAPELTAWIASLFSAEDAYRRAAESALAAGETAAAWERSFFKLRRSLKPAQRRRAFPAESDRTSSPRNPPAKTPAPRKTSPGSKARR